MNPAHSDTQTASPSQSLAQALRKPRGSASNMWNEIITLRDGFGWRQREIAILMDISDAMVSYVVKQPDLKVLHDREESGLVRQLFAPVRDESGKLDVESSLKKAANYQDKLNDADARGLVADLQNPDAYAARQASAPKVVRTPRREFGEASHVSVASAREPEAPAYKPRNEIEGRIFDAASGYLGAVSAYIAAAEACNESIREGASLAAAQRKAFDDAAKMLAERRSEMSKAVSAEHARHLREETEIKRAPVVGKVAEPDKEAANEERHPEAIPA